jgi:hypothetical protein
VANLRINRDPRKQVFLDHVWILAIPGG